ncbi:LacI family DNA-binding transcriptional regulator [Salipaludibacillus aurantiacus]|uniref:Catabolite control protein A n=1 Tax=Salipaludibacillus aurantiacus TaxID=1601833 RepID=A0A1H9TFX6_9BACI|nr:LacI family DNA-binding transcriptional regulator [Salipaludibacillus aurantiacus]SER95719.1 LacI family transcriptional regulator [Salipaludibacillus aurantiacus]
MENISMKDVAQKAKVSTATVSHVINETRYVAEETKKKVYKAMKELDYQPNSVARSLRSRKSNIIGLLVPLVASDTSNFFFMSIANGIEQVLKENGYNLILSNSSEDLSIEQDQIKVFNSQLIDGLIIAPVDSQKHDYKENLRGNYPVVFIDRQPKELTSDTVLIDSGAGTYKAIELLISKGHTKIGFITGPLGITTSDERLQAYKNALKNNNLSYDESLVKIGSATFDKGHSFTKELVEETGATAIFAANNIMTMGAVHYLQEKDIPIPDKVAIIGFDDYDWLRITSPPLSVVKQPSYEMGKKAVELLIKRINGSKDPYDVHRLPSELVVRGSC